MTTPEATAREIVEAWLGTGMWLSDRKGLEHGIAAALITAQDQAIQATFAERDVFRAQVAAKDEEIARLRDDLGPVAVRMAPGELGRLATKVWNERGVMAKERDTLRAQLDESRTARAQLAQGLYEADRTKEKLRVQLAEAQRAIEEVRGLRPVVVRLKREMEQRTTAEARVKELERLLGEARHDLEAWIAVADEPTPRGGFDTERTRGLVRSLRAALTRAATPPKEGEPDAIS